MNPHLTCITCKFYTPAENVIGFATCKEPKSAYPDHVNGGISWTFCHNMRNDFGECKPAADLWEPNADAALQLERDRENIHNICRWARDGGEPYETTQVETVRRELAHPSLLSDDEIHDILIDYLPSDPVYTKRGEE